MIKKVLIFTVGGRPAPIIDAIKLFKPYFVYFLATKNSVVKIDGPGVSIVNQTNLQKSKYKTIIVDADDMDECYKTLREIDTELMEKISDADVIANFTGGTKTMSASLAALA